MNVIRSRIAALSVLALLLVGCTNQQLVVTSVAAASPVDWITQLAVVQQAARQKIAHPVLVSMLASPTSDHWYSDPQTVPSLETTLAFADASSQNTTALELTLIRYTNPPLTGTVQTQSSIVRQSASPAEIGQRLSMQDAFTTMRVGPLDVYRMTAQAGADFLGDKMDRTSLVLGTLYTPTLTSDSLLPPDIRRTAPPIVWSILYSRDNHSLQFIIDPYTGAILTKTTK